MEQRKENSIDYAHVCAMPTLLLIGLVGQCLNLFTLRHRSLNGVSFIYLRAGAMADILSIVALVPFVVRMAKRHWSTSYEAMWYHAHLELPLVNSLIAAGTLCIVGLTFERYLSICHPGMAVRTIKTAKRTRIICCVFYVVGLFIFAPSAYQKVIYEHIVNNGTNETRYLLHRRRHLLDDSLFQAYLLVRELIARLGPIVVVVILNGLIARRLRKSAKRHRLLKLNSITVDENSCAQTQTEPIPKLEKSPSVERKNTKKLSATLNGYAPTPRQKKSIARAVYESEHRIYVLLLITSITFVICTLPASLLSLFLGHRNTHGNKHLSAFRAVANLLEVTSYFANFYIYALCSSEYRQAFLEMIGFRRSGSGEKRISYGDTMNGLLRKRRSKMRLSFRSSLRRKSAPHSSSAINNNVKWELLTGSEPMHSAKNSNTILITHASTHRTSVA